MCDFPRHVFYVLISARPICEQLCGARQQWNEGSPFQSQVRLVLIIHTDLKKLRWDFLELTPSLISPRSSLSS